jgi:hypothetical protein
MEAIVETRSTRTTLTFRRAFMLPRQTTTVPAGDYILVIEEERLQGLTFDAYLRVAGYLIVGGGPAHPGRTEMIPISEIELARLIEQDRAPAGLLLSVSLPTPSAKT